MHPVIRTPRLLLRGWQDSDRVPFSEMGRDPEVMRHFPALLTRAESDAAIDLRFQPHIEQHGFGLWAVERTSDSAFLGFTGLAIVDFACPLEGHVEIGWRLCRDAWGQGYAYEAASASANFAFSTLDLDSIFAMTVAGNERSQRLMARLGMRRRLDLDFEHPRVPEGSPVRPQIVFELERART